MAEDYKKLTKEQLINLVLEKDNEIKAVSNLDEKEVKKIERAKNTTRIFQPPKPINEMNKMEFWDWQIKDCVARLFNAKKKKVGPKLIGAYESRINKLRSKYITQYSETQKVNSQLVKDYEDRFKELTDLKGNNFYDGECKRLQKKGII